jgi:hypothetical protein
MIVLYGRVVSNTNHNSSNSKKKGDTTNVTKAAARKSILSKSQQEPKRQMDSIKQGHRTATSMSIIIILQNYNNGLGYSSALIL